MHVYTWSHSCQNDKSFRGVVNDLDFIVDNTLKCFRKEEKKILTFQNDVLKKFHFGRNCDGNVNTCSTNTLTELRERSMVESFCKFSFCTNLLILLFFLEQMKKANLKAHLPCGTLRGSKNHTDLEVHAWLVRSSVLWRHLLDPRLAATTTDHVLSDQFVDMPQSHINGPKLTHFSATYFTARQPNDIFLRHFHGHIHGQNVQQAHATCAHKAQKKCHTNLAFHITQQFR